MNNIIVLNFRFALLSTIVGSLIQIWYNHISPQALEYINYYPSYQAQIKGAPFFNILLPVVGWFSGFKDNEKHSIAFFMGFIFLTTAIGTRLSEMINGQYFNDIQEIFQWYIGISCIAYSYLGLKKLV
ncbi:MAG: hypothetical protein WC799_25275 [Desulfobacteraceae bacterium]